MMQAMISWFRYVPLDSFLVALAAGWEPVAELGRVHGCWSVLCRWPGEGAP